MTIIEEINEIKKKISLREWIINELGKFESKFGISTKDFIKKWRSKKIPEPEDHMVLEEFLEWEGLLESLEKVDNELKDIENRIRES
ncbi:MAG: hypothetical protein ACTSRL_22615 [Candidatus Helarchaeota archaeon]